MNKPDHPIHLYPEILRWVKYASRPLGLIL